MSLRCVRGILNASKNEVNLKSTLKGGMCFRWVLTKETNDETEFIGVISKRIYILKQIESKNRIEYEAYWNDSIANNNSKNDNSDSKINDELVDYFRLNENIDELYDYWSKRDEKFSQRVQTYPNVLKGIRSLRIEPVENLFSFICSSNNNIKRITQMVSNMCIKFGHKIGTLNGVDHFSFPIIDRLAQNDVESKLRQLNFGYRAKYIHQAAVHIKQNYLDDTWLYSLRDMPYEQVVQLLIKIPGIGKKVADCICLMSLDKLEAIPVDTHVYSIAKNTYNFIGSSGGDSSNSKQVKSKKSALSDKSYKEIGDKFRNLWGKYAGWAQTIMFIDALKEFKEDKSSLNLLMMEHTAKSETFLIKNEPFTETKCTNFAVKQNDNSPKTKLKRSNSLVINSPSEKLTQVSKKKKTCKK